MFYLPPLRRLLFPALILFAVIVFYRSSVHVPGTIISLNHSIPPQGGIHVPIRSLSPHAFPLFNASSNHISPSKEYFYANFVTSKSKNGSNTKGSTWMHPTLNSYLDILFRCPTRPNRITNHIRLSNAIRNVSMIPPNSSKDEMRMFWNPTILSLPYWSQNQYLLVSRIVTDGLHQQNVLCEANTCYTGSSEGRPVGEKACSEGDVSYLGAVGGMRCETEPVILSVPPTPAESCEGKLGAYVDIPGFHDPRIFWSGKGEPLMMVPLRLLWPLDDRPAHLVPTPLYLMSYPVLTELTRNPPSDRSPLEKNWMLFFLGSDSYIQYEISPRSGRTMAKVLGGGLTTTNLTEPSELPCLFEDSKEDQSETSGSWHQATNSLRLILCEQKERDCLPNAENTVFFAVVHRKLPNFLKLPMRYERYFILWSALPPFSMLGVSQHPILMSNETATGFSPDENWDDDDEALKNGRGNWASFTYTVSIAYAWGRKMDSPTSKNTGYLDDEVVLGIGIDDKSQGFAVATAKDLLQCLRACPGRAP
ncbi:hypothetical protein GP486_004050 [Trichoglossum hirsutum]|uniref:Uncharacterized protein n=1 Tax=Trichoglossum hirsutum TaxID=265104 RepID=A0A9P8LBP8_9PEZI|nr:hypothetical protein GP486_004050 [Trichoglossum hirsutum]